MSKVGVKSIRELFSMQFKQSRAVQLVPLSLEILANPNMWGTIGNLKMF